MTLKVQFAALPRLSYTVQMTGLVPIGNGEPEGGIQKTLVIVPMQEFVTVGGSQLTLVSPPAVVARQVLTMMLVEQEIPRQLQGVPLGLANVMDWLQKSTTPQAWPIQEAVMTGQLVTNVGPMRMTALVQQLVLIQVGGGNVMLVFVHATV